MTPENFTYWLQGYLELSRRGTINRNVPLDSVQIKIIEDHLDLVFTKKTSLPILDTLKSDKCFPSLPKNITVVGNELYC